MVHIISMSSFAGKTYLIEKLTNHECSRHYDANRHYRNFYHIPSLSSVVVDLDDDSNHYMELLKSTDLKLLFSKWADEYSKCIGKPISDIFILCHYKIGAQLYIYKEPPTKNTRDEDSLFSLRLEVNNSFKDDLKRHNNSELSIHGLHNQIVKLFNYLDYDFETARFFI